MQAYFTSGSVGGNSRRQLASIFIGECERIESGPPFCNLEPIGATTIPACSSTRRFAKINRSRTWVVECIVEFEANGGASCNLDRLSSRSGVDIASNVRRGNRSNRGVAKWHANGRRRGRAARNESIPYI